MTPHVPNSQPVTNNNKTVNDRMLEGGYQMVGKARKPSRVFTNSTTRTKQSIGLQNAHRRHDNAYCSIFVSNLTTDTNINDVADFLFKKHELRFKV